MTATVVTGPTYATSFSLNSDGTFSYTHNGSTNVIDSFTYQANDGSNTSNAATVTIDVSINQPPVAISSCSTTAQESAKNGTLNATDADNSLLTFSLGANGSAGSGPMSTIRGSVEITNPTTGAYTYTPSASGPRGADSFTFYVEDTNGGFATATETIIVDQKIMPLGDSITRGTGSTINGQIVGYRKPLYDSLIAAGYRFDFVGSDIEGKGVGFDYNNEGHSGWKAIEIAFGGTGGHANNPPGGIRDWLDDNPADVIILHIGTNDGPVSGTEDDAEAILNEIDLWENSSKGNPVTVILARIVNQDPLNSDVTTYNNALALMASLRATDDIVLVDMQSPLSYPADLGDSVHPNAGGYAKMAPVWHADLVPVLDKCP